MSTPQEADGDQVIWSGDLLLEAVSHVVARAYASWTALQQQPGLPPLSTVTEATYRDPSVLMVLDRADVALPPESAWSAYLAWVDEQVFDHAAPRDLRELRDLVHGRLIFRLARIAAVDDMALMYGPLSHAVLAECLPRMGSERGAWLFHLWHLVSQPFEALDETPVH